MNQIFKNILSGVGVLAVFVFLLATFIFPATTHAAGYVASDVLGQTDVNGNPVFTTGATNNSTTTPNAIGFNNPYELLLDTTNHRLFVAERSNYRVLVFNLDSNNNLISHTANYVIGQPNFASSTNTANQSSFGALTGLAYDPVNNYLFVVGFGNSRVLVFDLSGGITNGMSASYELGVPNGGIAYTGTGWGCVDIYCFSNPYSVVYDSAHKRLFVTDHYNVRVMIFDLSGGITNGMNASYELGQASSTAFTTRVGTTTQSGFGSPSNIAYDTVNQRLFIGDSVRVLVFDLSGTITNGMNASWVLGQPDFITSTATTTQNGLKGVSGLSYDQTTKQLFVTDGGNKRILIFDLSNGITNGMNASEVLGQTDFVSSSASAITQTTLNNPTFSRYDPVNKRLYVTDNGNNRILIFNFIKMPSSINTPGGGPISTQDLSGIGSQGTVILSLTSGTLPPGLSLSGSTITGTPSTLGNYTFTITATDTITPGTQVFTDSQTYTMNIVSASSIGGGGGGSYFQTSPINTSSYSYTTPVNQPVTVNVPLSVTSPTTPTPPVTPPTITTPTPITATFSSLTTAPDLKLGTTNNEVLTLQNLLNSQGFTIATTGAGSPGHESTYFGLKTQKALIKFQKAHGITPASGYFGAKTKAYIAGH